MHTPLKFYQTGTFTVGNRLLAPEQRSVQASTERSNTLNSGHRACQGCGEALGARYAIDDAMRATGGLVRGYKTEDAQTIVVALGSVIGTLKDTVDELRIAGLGGRAITKASLHRTLREAIADQLQPLTFMDLDWRIVNRQLERERAMRRSGPIAENLLRDIGTVASKVH